MLRPPQFILIAVIILSPVCTTLFADDTMSADTANTAAPHLSAVSPSGCIKPGDALTISGENLLPQTDRQLVLYGGKNQIPLKTKQWTESTITAVVPSSPAIKPRRQYMLGIKTIKERHWLSNRDVLVVVCDDKAASQ